MENSGVARETRLGDTETQRSSKGVARSTEFILNQSFSPSSLVGAAYSKSIYSRSRYIPSRASVPRPHICSDLSKASVRY